MDGRQSRRANAGAVAARLELTGLPEVLQTFGLTPAKDIVVHVVLQSAELVEDQYAAAITVTQNKHFGEKAS